MLTAKYWILKYTLFRDQWNTRETLQITVLKPIIIFELNKDLVEIA